MTEEEKQAILWAISHNVAEGETIAPDDFWGGTLCVFCNRNPDCSVWRDFRQFKHGADCVVLVARKLIEENPELQKAENDEFAQDDTKRY